MMNVANAFDYTRNIQNSWSKVRKGKDALFIVFFLTLGGICVVPEGAAAEGWTSTALTGCFCIAVTMFGRHAPNRPGIVYCMLCILFGSLISWCVTGIMYITYQVACKSGDHSGICGAGNPLGAARTLTWVTSFMAIIASFYTIYWTYKTGAFRRAEVNAGLTVVSSTNDIVMDV